MTNKPWLTPAFVARCIPMPRDPSLLEMWKPGLSPARVVANRLSMLARMQEEINMGRERRGECVYCGKHHGDSFACLSND